MLGPGKTSHDNRLVTCATHERHHDTVFRDRVGMLYAALPLSQGILAIVAFVLFQFHATRTPAGQSWGWLALMCCILGLRGLSAWLYRYRHRLLADERAWLLTYRVTAVAAGVAWGLTAFLFNPPDNETLQVFTLLVLAGVIAGALSSMTGDFFTYRLFAPLVLAPFGLVALARGGQMQMSIALFVFLMLVFMLKSSRTHSQSIVDSLTLRYQNSDLIEDLENEKQRLISEAETMMGTVLSCAPVALWAIDNDGVITFMDANHLGRRNGLKLPRVGDNLLDVFSTHTQIVDETQRALRGESFVTEIDVQDHSYEVHYSPLPSQDGTQQGAIGVAIDVSERKRHAQELARRAHYDQLTGLPNRSLIMSQVEQAFEQAKRHRRHVALFFLDLDNFKVVNDTMGHKAGDKLLRQTADRLRLTLRETDMPARLGGDEFVVVSENMPHPEDAEVVAHKITEIFQRPFVVDNREIFASTSIGIAVYPQDGLSAEQLLQSADTAMYHAKSLGKNGFRFFTDDMQQTAERHLAIETELRRALQRGELRLLYQPKIDLGTRRIQGAEALLRWESPTLGQVGPDEFVPVAELAGLMPQIGDWVLREACREAGGWQGSREEPVHVAVNVSPQQFRNTDLLANVGQALAASGLSADLLELEITESVLVQDAPETLRIFTDLHDLGVGLSLDDFGTGYSSLSYLKKFPMQVLKIDKAFVQDVGQAHEGESLVDAIIAMAHSLHLKIVAEGVETADQLRYLEQRRVDLVQGYLFSRPLDAGDFRRVLAQEPLPEDLSCDPQVAAGRTAV